MLERVEIVENWKTEIIVVFLLQLMRFSPANSKAGNVEEGNTGKREGREGEINIK